MNRTTRNEYMQEVLYYKSLLPPIIQKYIENSHILIGLSPIFVGLHNYKFGNTGRSNESTSHCVYGWALDQLSAPDRITTIVLLNDDHKYPDVIYHELGHVLQDALPWEILPDQIKSFNWYANLSYGEAFATAFQTFAAHITGKGDIEELEKMSKYDKDTLQWFDHIAKNDIFKG